MKVEGGALSCCNHYSILKIQRTNDGHPLVYTRVYVYAIIYERDSY